MGQQQLLLIILGVIVVGIAVAVGITMFTDNATSANRDAVVNDLVNLSARAQQYYRRPTTLGGGGNVFTGCTLSDLVTVASGATSYVNANGSYSIVGAVTDSLLTIQGEGNEIGNDGSGKVKVTMEVRAGRTQTTINN
ncbi:MAG TPA: hypothetical protein VGB89_03100 [Bacteroidota bacterium]|jgi:hypothetical protein